VAFSPIGLVVLVAFWLWTPWFLLHGQIALRLLLPGALLVAVTYMGAVTVSEFVLGYWITDNGRFFGSFGVVLALLAWGAGCGRHLAGLRHLLARLRRMARWLGKRWNIALHLS
jgi:hypothetical protein